MSYLSRNRSNNLQIELVRNRYLFGRSMADFRWLLQHQNKFTLNLVRNFGYDADPSLNKAALNDAVMCLNKRNYTNPCHDQYMGELFYGFDCTGLLHIRSGMIEYFMNHIVLKAGKNIIQLMTIFPCYNNACLPWQRMRRSGSRTSLKSFVQWPNSKRILLQRLRFSDIQRIFGIYAIHA